MYKTQMKLQKILCLITLIAGALVFLYSLGIMTDLYDALYSTMRSSDLTKTDVSGSIVFYDMQPFNKSFLKLSIGLILVALTLYITNTHVRRRYYIGNFISVGLFAIYSIAMSIWAHIQIEHFKGEFLKVDFVALKEFSEMWNTLYTESTFWFDIHYVVFDILLIVAVLQVLNAGWKVMLMKDEAALISGERRAEA